MRHAIWTGLLVLLPAVAHADKKGAPTRAEIEGDLRVAITLTSPAKVRPGAPIHVEAVLENASKERTHQVIDPGNGCAMGIVEPHIYYTAVYTPHAGKPRTIKGPDFGGMCGMGDYRWHNRVRDLAPGESLPIHTLLSHVSASMDMRTAGRYALRVHYAFNRRGTTQKLPDADPLGDLGPMKSCPKFEVVSEPVMVHVVRPVEVFVEPRGVLKKGVARRLSDLVTVRLENWESNALHVDVTQLKVGVEVQAGAVKRKPVSVKSSLIGTIKLKPAASLVLVGANGLYDEAWAPTADGPVDVRVSVRGVGFDPIHSLPTRIRGP